MFGGHRALKHCQIRIVGALLLSTFSLHIFKPINRSFRFPVFSDISSVSPVLFILLCCEFCNLYFIYRIFPRLMKTPDNQLIPFIYHPPVSHLASNIVWVFSTIFCLYLMFCNWLGYLDILYSEKVVLNIIFLVRNSINLYVLFI